MYISINKDIYDPSEIVLFKVGGLMAFFLGISAVSIIECLCYFCVSIKRKCDGESDEEPERQQWKSRMNEVEDKDHARHQRQQQNFHEMEQKLRQLDGAQRI